MFRAGFLMEVETNLLRGVVNLTANKKRDFISESHMDSELSTKLLSGGTSTGSPVYGGSSNEHFAPGPDARKLSTYLMSSAESVVEKYDPGTWWLSATGSSHQSSLTGMPLGSMVFKQPGPRYCLT